MKIISLKENLYTGKEFIDKVNSLSYIDGISVDITMTKDGYIILYNYDINNAASLGSVQNTTFSNIQTISIGTLEDFLHVIKEYPKKIVLHLLPILTPTIHDDNIEMLNDIFSYFVNQVYHIIRKFPNLKIEIATSSGRLLYYLKKKKEQEKLGLIIRSDDLNYHEVDFYVFSAEMFDLKIMNQQLDLGKEIMMYLITSNEISVFMDVFNKESLNENKNRILEHLQIITPYPEIIKRTLL